MILVGGYPWHKKKTTRKDGVKIDVATKSVHVEDAPANIGVDADLEAMRDIPGMTGVKGDVGGETGESMIATLEMEIVSTPANIRVDLVVKPEKSVPSASKTETTVP